MKNLILWMLLISFNASMAQSFLEAYEATRHLEPYDHVNGTYNDDFARLRGNANEWSKVMGVFYEFDDIRFAKLGFDGTILLFEEWDNKGVIVVGNTKYLISNINFHITRGQFMTQLENDSTFVYDFRGIDKIVVNNRSFKPVFDVNAGINKVLEVIYETKDFGILKDYSISLVEASPNPMLNRTRNKLKRNSQYYVHKNGGLSAIRLKKSTILDLVSANTRNQIDAYARQNKLSYKNENDLKRIFQHYESRKSLK